MRNSLRELKKLTTTWLLVAMLILHHLNCTGRQRTPPIHDDDDDTELIEVGPPDPDDINRHVSTLV